MQMKPLALLAALEARLEEEIAAAAAMPPEVVQAAEHAREKERRRVSPSHGIIYCHITALHQPPPATQP
jgi:hypothetical protein